MLFDDIVATAVSDHDDPPEEAPEIPTDEPQPAPVQDPPAEPDPTPYVVRAHAISGHS
jgi:hypothetical protein